ncbi:CHASE2 domain-containing protein [Oscillatoria sp. CS-180]|uniref:sensor histidine kinase n=1 Tax=Oscillatoria sp. CS-180 TaxID=3021720 RepID=UPI00232E4792|nr:CHASE2 domain-containing protein [Oscillatoria sp. CS-180]MDB9527460.1 CHASE2 domain-containing protein [Oscillatoria sp. CS-180]
MTNSNNSSQIWQTISRASWQRRILPGVTVIVLMLALRALGAFQELEWKALDSFLRWRPAEPTDKRLLIVGIDEQDIQAVGTYPIPDANLAALITRLKEARPYAIGIDIYRDFPVEPGHADLTEILAESSQVFGIEAILSDTVAPPPPLPPEQVGFNDFPIDADGFVRRAYLGAFPPVGHPTADEFRVAFPLVLAEAYLAQQDLFLTNGQRNPENMQFGDTELIRFSANSGSYVGVNATGIQMLVNVRSGPSPFEQVSMTDVLSGQVDEALIRDRIVLVGVTALSVKDQINSAAANTLNPRQLYGVEMHAHITSQILSAVLDDRPLIVGWAEVWEYLWIVLWGIVGMVLIRFLTQPAWYLLSVGVIALGLVGLSLLLLWWFGWWIPVIPTLIGFTLNGLVLPGFYLYDQTLRSRITERQRVIEETYDAIHNGPLQTLALLLRQKETLDPQVNTQLADLNKELRTVYNRLQQESLPQDDQLQLGSQQVVDLRNALHEVLYEVYVETLKRDFPGFDSLKFKVIKFEPLTETKLTPGDRRAICRLLEEMLCNIGKHAVNPKRLTIFCGTTETDNIVRVEDNGKGNPDNLPLPQSTASATGGRGTQQAQDLAHRLGGTFQRSFEKNGTHCELRWPLRRQFWWKR